MGKQRKGSRQHADVSTTKSERGTPARSGFPEIKSLKEWLEDDNHSLYWIGAFLVVGGILGFIAGSGVMPIFTYSNTSVQWRKNIGAKLRSKQIYELLTTGRMSVFENFELDFMKLLNPKKGHSPALDPSHPFVFALLREAVVREKGGYVNYDLGFQVPAPSGAARGIGMVRDSYYNCQSQCLPGIGEEKLAEQAGNSSEMYRQEEVLVRVPLGFQMTRRVALETLTSVLPEHIQQKASLHELDDAALLVLLLAHERGVGDASRWVAYIASLPTRPSCGYSRELRPYMLDAINVMRDELGINVQGWPDELQEATNYSEKISSSLTRDYGGFLKTPEGVTAGENIEWALCQVASRATAGNDKHGTLRLVPILDLVNHDQHAGGFIELTGDESLENGHFVDASEDDSGTFVIRSLRHGRRKALKKGQELLANYNVPQYTPLDWFISLGFVPPERWGKWEKINPAFPAFRKDHSFQKDTE